MTLPTLPVSYTSIERIISAFPPINSITTLSSANIAQFAGDVEAEINARVAERYTIPLASPVPLLMAIATRETIYRIVTERALIQFPPAQQGQHPLQIGHAGDQKLLDRIAAGDISLITSSGAAIAESSADADAEVWTTTKDYTPTFHEGDWGDMIQHEDKLDDILSDRDL